MTGTVKALTVDEAPISHGSEALDDAVSDVTVRMRDGVPWLVRTAQRFGGVACSVAALTLLLFPFGVETTTALLCKLMVALVLGFVGAALWQAGTAVAAPEMEIDLVRREVRFVRWVGKSRHQTSKAPFSALGHAEVEGRTVRLWDKSGGLVADVTVPDPTTMRSLQHALQDEGVPV